MTEPNRSSSIDRPSAWSWHLGLEIALWSTGGIIVSQMEPPGPASDAQSAGGALWIALLTGALLAGVAGTRLRRGRRGKWLLFSTILHAVLLLTTACVAEAAVRRFIPEWPGRELHGVSAAVWERSQAPVARSVDDVGINSWGQRDQERARRPVAGTLRIACIGDSFLEEGASVPVSLLIERRLDRDDVEVLNLGVSATGPDEYYDRTCRVAIPLNVGHCVVFIYAGNDFATLPRTLESFGGIAAVAPRTSFLRLCGLSGVNHMLTNHRRPVMRAWFESGDLATREQSMHALITSANDDQLRSALLNADQLPTADRARLAARLWRPEMADFFEILREPDDGRFRSYYLSAALWSASVGGGQWEPDSPVNVNYWIEQTVAYCRARGVKTTIVIIPDGFQVDPRMVDQWSPLTDMTHLTQPTRKAAAEFRQHGVEQGWDVLDLHDRLEGVSGAYLNLDGHWSSIGAEVAAQAVAEHLKANHGL